MTLQTALNKVEESLKTPTEETKAKLYKTLDIDFTEKTSYFDLNIQSFASGIIDKDTSQFIYNKLRTYENTTLAERIVISQIMLELLQKRMNAN